ncbi:MAG: hypothetical protein MPK10_01465 [Gammaproteobacteria bacterium]|nr:hypothetical protein [Gammaproteobacteria bacterium]MDA7971239.1 hypothetical protein [Gammaproteobacteria bacterium]
MKRPADLYAVGERAPVLDERRERKPAVIFAGMNDFAAGFDLHRAALHAKQKFGMRVAGGKKSERGKSEDGFFHGIKNICVVDSRLYLTAK